MTWAFATAVAAFLSMTFGRELENYIVGFRQRYGKKRNFKRYSR